MLDGVEGERIRREGHRLSKYISNYCFKKCTRDNNKTIEGLNSSSMVITQSNRNFLRVS